MMLHCTLRYQCFCSPMLADFSRGNGYRIIYVLSGWISIKYRLRSIKWTVFKNVTHNLFNKVMHTGETVWLLTCKFPISLTLVNCQRCLKSENKDIFTIISCFSNYFATNHSCARNAICLKLCYIILAEVYDCHDSPVQSLCWSC